MKYLFKNKILLSISIVVVAALVFVMWSLLDLAFNKDKIEKVVTEDVHEHEHSEETELENHVHLGEQLEQDIEDAFEDGKDKAVISKIEFEKPLSHNGAANPGTGAKLLGGAGNNLLLHSYGGYLYLYDIKTEKPFIIDKSTASGSIDDENKMVFYEMYAGIEKDAGKKDIYAMDIPTKTRQKVGTIGEELVVKSSIVYNGIYLYYAENLTKVKSADGVAKHPDVSQAELNKYKSVVDKYNFTYFYRYQDRIFGFDKKTKTIYDITNGKETKILTLKTGEILYFATNGKNTYVRYIDSKDQTKVVTEINNTSIKELENTNKFMWVDEIHALALKNNNLYLYTTSENNLESVLSNANDFYTYFNNGRIYSQQGNSSMNKTIDVKTQ